MKIFKNYFFYFLIFTIGLSGGACAQYSEWEKTVGGTNFDEGISVVATTDGGYAITGTTESYGQGGYDVYIIKLNTWGSIEWTKTIGGTGTDIGFSIIQTKDKGYAVAGYTNSFGAGGYDVYVIKMDSLGNVQWTKTIGGAYNDYGYGIVQANDGGYVIAGSTVIDGFYPNGYVVKLDSSGNLQWSKAIGLNNEDFYSITKTNDGGYAVAGLSETYGYYSGFENVYVVKLDSSGTIQWTRTVGGRGGYDGAYAIIQSSDGGFVTVGYTDSYGQGDYDVYVVKLDASGNLLWTKTIGGSGNDLGHSIVQTNDKGFAIAGQTNSYGAGNNDVYLIKLDSSANLQWTNTIGGPDDDDGSSVINTADGGFALTGRTLSYGAGNGDVFLIKFNPLGNTCSTNGNGGLLSSGGLASYGYDITLLGTEGSGGIIDSGEITTTICQTATCSLNITAGLFSSRNSVCFGESNAFAIVTGGTPPYTYIWNPSGGTNDTATGLTAGTYTVNVADSNGCIGYALITIPPTILLHDSIGSTCATCCNCIGTTHIYVWGGTKPYSYLWSNGRTNDTLESLSSATYTCTVTDSNGCTIIDSIFVHHGSNASVSQTNPPCYGGSGSASISVVGSYNFIWSPSGGTGATASGLSAGTYTVSVTQSDTASCFDDYVITITQPPQLTLAASIISNVNCYGGNNGSATVVAGGGTPGYSYVWSPSGGNGATANGLTAGTYNVKVTDANGCTADASVTITQPATFSVTISFLSYGCSLQPTLQANVSGGTPPYTYAWQYGDVGNTEMLTYWMCPEPTSDYVNVTDSRGCTAYANIALFPPVIWQNQATTQTNVTCYGGNNGSITFYTCGGNGGYTYHWNSNSASSYNQPYTASNLTAGAYSVYVTDGDGCNTQTFSVTITQPPALIVSASVTSNITCSIGNNGSASSNVSGGTSPYTYSWSGGHGTNTTASGLSAGTYTLNITDNHGCINTATITITEPSISVTTTTTFYGCTGPGSATALPSNGISPYTYSWSGGGGTNATATGLSVGTYTVNVTDYNGCTGSAIAIVTQPASLTVSSNTYGNITCSGDNNGYATITPSGGTSPYTYSWNPSGGTTNSVSGLSEGTYVVTISDNNGCSVSASFTISQPLLLNVSVNTTSNVLCNGGNNGIASSSASGGTSPYTYLWSGGHGTNATASGLSAGIYTITITDHNGCVGSAIDTITQPANVLSVSVNITSEINCNGGNNGGIASNVNGGVSPYTYAWSAGGGTNVTTTGLSSGAYTLTVTDNNGCTGSATAVITQPTQLNVSATPINNVSCFGGDNGSASSTVSGGTSPFTYLWSDANSQSTASAIGLSVGTYTVTVIDSCGSSVTASTSISQPTQISVVADSINDNGGCSGSAWALVSGGVTPYTYLWTGGGTTDTITNQCYGNYCCTVTDANGCLDSLCVTITLSTGTVIFPENTSTITVYPNPNNGIFTLESSVEISKSIIEIYNVLGQKIYSTNLILSQDGDFEININDKAAGVYFYRISKDTGELLSSGKLIIER